MGRLDRDLSSTPKVDNVANRIALLTGLIAGIAYSTFASFVANALTPMSGRLIELDLLRRSVSGRYEEVLSLNGVIPTVLGATIVGAMVWLMTRATLEHLQSEEVTV
ncbi:MAG TPA: hypothetical protein VNO74_05650 [Methylomirabilota bacterium]|nr:hypothetical protein [Methylomirabilota bacterium]